MTKKRQYIYQIPLCAFKYFCMLIIIINKCNTNVNINNICINSKNIIFIGFYIKNYE